MQRISLLAFVLFALNAATTLAAEPVHVRGDAITPDGALMLPPIDFNGSSVASTQEIVEIESPQVSGDSYALSGKVEYTDVAGTGFLEMWSYFPDGGHYFSRTLDASGQMGKLAGSSRARPFVLPFFLNRNPARPSRLVVNVVLPARGHVRVSELRFGPAGEASSAPGVWWSPRGGGWIGGIGGSAFGMVGGLIGFLCSRGRGRHFVLGALTAMAATGIAGATAGLGALLLGQPYEVWYPLLLGGGIAAVLSVGLRPTVRRRFEELRAVRRVT
ncbi:MAG TPA: hypothetical protein VKE73_03015 [Myxococcota bacterium]|nr:hypothetical protein [Myxococcota bacterium]